MADDKGQNSNTPTSAGTPEAPAETSWAAQVIDLFGGSKEMGLSLDMAPSTIDKWRERGEIPEGRWKEIFDGATRQGITLPPNPDIVAGKEVRIDGNDRKPGVDEDILEDELPDDGMAVGTAVILALIAFCLAITSPLWHSLFLERVGSGDPAVSALEKLTDLEEQLADAKAEIARIEKGMPDPQATPPAIRNLKSRVDSLQNQMSNVQTRTNNNQNDINNLQRRVDNLFQTGLPQPAYVPTYDDGTYDAANVMTDAAGAAGAMDGDDTTAATAANVAAGAVATAPVVRYAAPPAVAVPQAPVTVTTSGVTEASIIALRGEITDLRNRIEAVDEQADDALVRIDAVMTQIGAADDREAQAINNLMEAMERSDKAVTDSYQAADADMQRNLSNIRATMDAKLVDELNAVRKERNELIDTLVATVGSLEQRVASVSGRVAQAEGNLVQEFAALQNQVAEVEKTRLDGHSLVIALNQLRARTQTDARFENELAATIAVATDAPDVKAKLEALRPFAVSGVPTVDVMRERFSVLAPELLVARATGESAGWFGGAKRSLAQALTVRPAVSGEELPEDASFAVRVSFAEARLADGDLQGAYSTMLESIPQPCDPALQPGGVCPPEAEQSAWVEKVLERMGPWLDAAGQRLALDRAMAEVSAAGLARAAQ